MHLSEKEWRRFAELSKGYADEKKAAKIERRRRRKAGKHYHKVKGRGRGLLSYSSVWFDARAVARPLNSHADLRGLASPSLGPLPSTQPRTRRSAKRCAWPSPANETSITELKRCPRILMASLCMSDDTRRWVARVCVPRRWW